MMFSSSYSSVGCSSQISIQSRSLLGLEIWNYSDKPFGLAFYIFLQDWENNSLHYPDFWKKVNVWTSWRRSYFLCLSSPPPDFGRFSHRKNRLIAALRMTIM